MPCLGIGNRIEQIVANLLDNAVSFSEDNKEVLVEVSKSNSDEVILNILDEGDGFKEKDTSKIFRHDVMYDPSIQTTTKISAWILRNVNLSVLVIHRSKNLHFQ